MFWKRIKLPRLPLARIVGYASAATDPLWLFEAPELALAKLLQRTGTSLDDWDLLEINEAFAAQIVANGKAMKWDWERVNVNGGAIAVVQEGDPIVIDANRGVLELDIAAAELRRRLVEWKPPAPRSQR